MKTVQLKAKGVKNWQSRVQTKLHAQGSKTWKRTRTGRYQHPDAGGQERERDRHLHRTSQRMEVEWTCWYHNGSKEEMAGKRERERERTREIESKEEADEEEERLERKTNDQLTYKSTSAWFIIDTIRLAPQRKDKRTRYYNQKGENNLHRSDPNKATFYMGTTRNKPCPNLNEPNLVQWDKHTLVQTTTEQERLCDIDILRSTIDGNGK